MFLFLVCVRRTANPPCPPPRECNCCVLWICFGRDARAILDATPTIMVYFWRFFFIFFEEWRQHIKSGALYVFFLRPHISSIYIIHMQVCVYVVVCLWKRFCAFLPYYSWYSATVVFLCFLKSQLQLFLKTFILLLQYAKAQVSMVQSGCQPPTEKKNNWRKKWKTNAKNKKLVPERKEEWMNLKWTKKGGSFSIGTCWTFWWEIWLKSATVLSILYYDRCVPPPHYFSIYKIHSTIFLLKEKRKQMRETSLEFFTVSEYTTRRPARFRLANMYNDDDESTTCFGSLLLLLPLWKNKRRGKKKKKNW